MNLNSRDNIMGRILTIKRTFHLRNTISILVLYEFMLKPKSTRNYSFSFLMVTFIQFVIIFFCRKSMRPSKNLRNYLMNYCRPCRPFFFPTDFSLSLSFLFEGKNCELTKTTIAVVQIKLVLLMEYKWHHPIRVPYRTLFLIITRRVTI